MVNYYPNKTVFQKASGSSGNLNKIYSFSRISLSNNTLWYTLSIIGQTECYCTEVEIKMVIYTA